MIIHNMRLKWVTAWNLQNIRQKEMSRLQILVPCNVRNEDCIIYAFR